MTRWRTFTRCLLPMAIAVVGPAIVPDGARGIPLPAGIEFATEVDIEQAVRDGDLDAEVGEALSTLLQDPIDPSAADRNALYALPGLTWEQVDAIIAYRSSGVLSGLDDLARVLGIEPDDAERLHPFVTFEMAPTKGAIHGRAVAGIVWRSRTIAPGTWLKAEVGINGDRHAGILLAARPRNGLARSAGPGQSISLPRKAVRFDPAGLHVAATGRRWSWIVGTFRAGFGQQLTLDNSRRRQPDGWYPALEVSTSTDAGTVATPDGFWGGAVRVRGEPDPRGRLDATAFASYRLLDVPIRDIHYDRCPADQPGCPDHRRVPAAVDAATGRSLFCEHPTLPWAMHEALGGAHVAWRFDERTVAGATGYVAWRRFRLDAPGLRPAVSSRFPWDRALFGAAGLHAAWGRGPVDAAAELTVTDRGAPAALVVGWLRPAEGVEVRGSFRYYAPGFDNPYARGESDADSFQGIRARDEIGGRMDLDWRAARFLSIRAGIDVWHHRFAYAECDPDDAGLACPPPVADPDAPAATPRPSTDLAFRFEARILPWVHEALNLTVEYRDEDLSRSGRRLSYAPYRNASGDWSGGARIRWTASASTRRLPRTRIAAAFSQVFFDTYALSDRFDRSWTAWLDLRTDLTPGPDAGLRLRFTDASAVDDPLRSPGQACASEHRDAALPERLPARCRGETALNVRLHAVQRLALPRGGEFAVRLQGDWTRWLDDRARWRTGTPCDRRPARDRFGLHATLTARF